MEIPSSVFVAFYPDRHSKMRAVVTSLQPSLQVRQIAEKITENKKRNDIQSKRYIEKIRESPQRSVADF